MWPFSKSKKGHLFIPSRSLRDAVNCANAAKTKKLECDEEIERLIKKEHPEYAAYCRILDDIHNRQATIRYFGEEAQTTFESFWKPVSEYIQDMKDQYRDKILSDCVKEES